MLAKTNISGKLACIFMPIFEKGIDKIWVWLYHTREVSSR